MTTTEIADWAVELCVLPPRVHRAAERSLYNYIGCAIGGLHHPTVIKATAVFRHPFGGPHTEDTNAQPHEREAQPSDPQEAALLLGIASHVHDYDDTHLATIIHPTGPVASALLACVASAEDRTISGEEVLVALVAGVEVSCKLGLAVWPSHYDVGWHITSTTGSIGAAVAVGKVMGLGREEMRNAIGIAATQVTGLREFFGTDTKAFHVGRAAQNGLLAAMLARGGFTAAETAIEGKRGWANVVVGDGEARPQLERYLSRESEEGLGQTWEVERNAFKPFPCGIVCHPAIDGCIQIREQMDAAGLKLEEIRMVEIQVHPLVMELTSKRRPRDGLEAKFSVFHGAAVGLVYGKAGPAQYADDVVTDSTVIAIRDRVAASIDTSLEADQAALTVVFESEDRIERRIEHAIGSLQVPMTDEQLSQKFLDQVSLVRGDEGARKLSSLAWEIAEVEDAAEIFRQF
jgi:aconitate decarboxylase